MIDDKERQSHDWYFLGNLAEETVNIHNFDTFFSFLIELSEQRSNIFVAQAWIDFAEKYFEALKADFLVFDALKNIRNDKVTFLNTIPQPIYDLIALRFEIFRLLRLLKFHLSVHFLIRKIDASHPALILLQKLHKLINADHSILLHKIEEDKHIFLCYIPVNELNEIVEVIFVEFLS